jgi:hypothetical protein
MKKFLGRADILTAGKIKFKDLRVPEWDSEGVEAWVRIKGWTIAEADDVFAVIQRVTIQGYVPADYTRQICAISIVDEGGQLCFGDGEDGENYKALGALSPEGMVRVREAALEFNLPKLTSLQGKMAKAIEQIDGPKAKTAKVDDSKN